MAVATKRLFAATVLALALITAACAAPESTPVPAALPAAVVAELQTGCEGVDLCPSATVAAAFKSGAPPDVAAKVDAIIAQRYASYPDPQPAYPSQRVLLLMRSVAMTTTPVNTFNDILSAMERYPHLREEMRRHILGEELLRLPAVVAELSRMVQTLADTVERHIVATNDRLDRLEAGLAELKAGQERLEARQDSTDARLDRMDQRFEQIDGRFEKIDQRFEKIDQRFEQIDERFEKIDQRFEQIDQRFEKIDQRFEQIDQRFERIEVRLNRVEGRLNSIFGSEYERKIARNSSRYLRQHANIRNARLLQAVTVPDNPHIPDLMADAVASGAISDDQADELDRADLVLLGETTEGQPTYAVAEVSATIDDHDVDRAGRRAAILRTASDVSATAIVIGAAISDANRQRAGNIGVTIVIVPE